MVAELAIGGASLVALAGTFSAALRQYFILAESMKSADAEHRLLAVKVLVEEQRFSLFGQYMDLLRDADAPTFRAQSPRSQSAINLSIREVEKLLSDSKVLLHKYGISMDGEGGDAGRALAEAVETDEPPQPGADGEVARAGGGGADSARLRFSKKIRWAIRDDRKASGLHRHLRDMNDGLWNLLAHHQAVALERAMPSFVIPRLDSGATLVELNRADRADALPALVAECAEMRTTVTLSPQQSDESSRRMIVKKTSIHVKKIYEGSGFRRGEAVFQSNGSSESVLVEYRTVPSNLKDTEKILAKYRVFQAAQQLSAPRRPEICLLQSLGVYEDSDRPLRLGIVFRMPKGSDGGIATLGSLLNNPKTFNDYRLGDRFALARALCYGVLHWHASGWLHKGIAPDNIVFPAPRAGPPDISAPRLLGFGSSRPARPEEESLASAARDGPIDLYRHPDYQARPAASASVVATSPGPPPARFHRSYDYYSLGVVLLLIGYWAPAERLRARFEAKCGERGRPAEARDARAWAAFLEGRALDSLAATCGWAYREAVLCCLRGDFGHGVGLASEADEWQKAFLFRVVDPLSRCVV